MIKKLIGVLFVVLVLLSVISTLGWHYTSGKLNELKNAPVVYETVTYTETVYDTLYVEHFVEKLKYIKVSAEIVQDTTAIDSAYNSMRDSAKAGSIPVVADSMKFGKHSLWTEYHNYPLNKFYYRFYPGPDTTIERTITQKFVIDTTPKLSLQVGFAGRFGSETTYDNFGLLLGLKIKSFGVQTTIFENSKTFGVYYSYPR